MADNRDFLDSIKFRGISKDIKEIRSKSTLNNKINLFQICKSSNDLRQFNRMIKQEYFHKINLIKCSRLDSLSSLKQTDNSIILLHQMYQKQIIDLLGQIQPLIVIYSTDIEASRMNQFNSTLVCFASKSEKALIRYFKQLLSKQFVSLRFELQNKGKYQSCLEKLPKLMTRLSNKKLQNAAQLSAKHMNDNWKYPSPTTYSPNIKCVSRKIKTKLTPLEKQKS